MRPAKSFNLGRSRSCAQAPSSTLNAPLPRPTIHHSLRVCEGERPGSQRLGSQGSVRKRLGSHGLGSHGLGSQGSVRKRLANTNSRERRGGTETREPRFLRTEPREPRRGNRDLANRACTLPGNPPAICRQSSGKLPPAGLQPASESSDEVCQSPLDPSHAVTPTSQI